MSDNKAIDYISGEPIEKGSPYDIRVPRRRFRFVLSLGDTICWAVKRIRSAFWGTNCLEIEYHLVRGYPDFAVMIGSTREGEIRILDKEGMVDETIRFSFERWHWLPVDLDYSSSEEFDSRRVVLTGVEYDESSAMEGDPY